MAKNKNLKTEVFGDVLQDIKGSFEPHNFSRKMCESIENQVDINSAIRNIIQVSLKDDVNMQNTIKSIIDKHVVYKLGLWLPTIITSILSVLVFIINYYK
jgi:hypothetical protein